jgi:hypothetical protein
MRVTSLSTGRSPGALATSLYSESGCTQCAAVKSRSRAIAVAVQAVPPEPKIITTDRPAPSAAGGAPPTMALLGVIASAAMRPKVQKRMGVIVTFILCRQRSQWKPFCRGGL